MAIKNNILIILICLLSSITALAQDQYRETHKGLKYRHIVDKSTTQAKIGDLVSLHMVMENEQGDVLRSTYREGKPLLFPVKISAFEGDLYEGVGMLSAGDSAAFKIPADSMYTHVFKKNLPENVEEGSDLVFTIKVLNVQSQQERLNELQKSDSVKKAKLKQKIEETKAAQEKAIKEYLASKGLLDKAERTEEGVYVIIDKRGNGEKINKGDAPSFHYTGKLFKGETFESSRGGHPVSFTVGEGNVIPGWEEGFKKLHTGDIATLIIPSHMAYSFRKKGEKIPPFSTLVFEVEVISVKR